MKLNIGRDRAEISGRERNVDTIVLAENIHVLIALRCREVSG